MKRLALLSFVFALGASQLASAGGKPDGRQHVQPQPDAARVLNRNRPAAPQVSAMQQQQQQLPRPANPALPPQVPRIQPRPNTPAGNGTAPVTSGSVAQRVPRVYTPNVTPQINTGGVAVNNPANQGGRGNWNRNGSGGDRNWDHDRNGGDRNWDQNNNGGERNWESGGGDRRGRGHHLHWDRRSHDRNWYCSNFTRFALFSGGYYYLNSGYWYPAYGYDPYFTTYSYDAPIYSYNGQEPGQVIANVQAELQRRGYNTGEVDGTYGPATRRALLQFQIDNGLPATGEIDEETLASLGLQ